MRQTLRFYLLAGLALVVLIVSGCTSSPYTMGQVAAACASPDIGVTTDENFRVVGLETGDGAIAAGVQIGDMLLDITWVPSDEPLYRSECVDVINVTHEGYLVDPGGNPYVDATGRRLSFEDMVGDPGPPRPAPRPVEGGTIPASPLPTGPASPVSTPRPSVVPPITVEVQPGSQPYTAPPPPPAADYTEKDTVRFTEDNVSRIQEMISFGVPLTLTVQRDGQVLEFIVDPIGPGANVTPVPDQPTPTPVVGAHHYF